MTLPGKSRLDDPVSFPKNNDEWHSFLLSTTDVESTHDRVELLIKLRDYIDARPETSATFKITNALDDGEATMITPEMLHLIGTWRVPDTAISSRVATAVNPNAAHAEHYSDMAVRCGCGAVMLREAVGENQPQPAQQQDHNEDCHKIHRHETRLQLLKNRRDAIIEMSHLGLTYREMASRIGYHRQKDVVPTVARNCGIDTDELQREGRRKTIRTFMVLLREYSPRVIGRLYDLSPRSVSDAVRKESVADPAALYSVRRRNGTTSGKLKATA